MHPIIPSLAKAAAGGLVLGGLIDYAVSKKNKNISKGVPTAITAVALVALRAMHFCLGKKFYPILGIGAMLGCSTLLIHYKIRCATNRLLYNHMLWMSGVAVGFLIGQLHWKQ